MVFMPYSFYIFFYIFYCFFYSITITIAIFFDGDAILVHVVIPIGNRSISIFCLFREEHFGIFATSPMVQLGRKLLATPKNLNFVIAVDMQDISRSRFEIPERNDDDATILDL